MQGRPWAILMCSCSSCRLENRLTTDMAAILQVLQRQALLVPPAYSTVSSPQPLGPEPVPGEQPQPITPVRVQALHPPAQVSPGGQELSLPTSLRVAVSRPVAPGGCRSGLRVGLPLPCRFPCLLPRGGVRPALPAGSSGAGKLFLACWEGTRVCRGGFHPHPDTSRVCKGSPHHVSKMY